MSKTERSTRLLKTAFAILFREKKLLLFPLIATGITLLLGLFFIAPVALYPTGHSYLSMAHWSAVGERFSQTFSTPRHSVSTNHPVLNAFVGGNYVIFQHWWITLVFAAAYFASMFLGIFCNVAFYHEIMQALNGKSVSPQRGFCFAMARWRAIAMWSLLAGTVGYIIQVLEQRVGFFGKIITSLIGFTWSLACVFIIPTLVRDEESANPIELLRHSAGTLKRTWGELVVGFVGLNVALFFIIFPVVLIMAFSGVLMLMPMLMFLVIMPISWLQNVVNSVYRCALFIYATEGVIPEPFNKELLDSAWKVK